MILDPQKKFQLIDEIVKYIDTKFGYEDQNGNIRHADNRVRILLGKFGINYSRDFFYSNDLENANDNNIS